MATDTVRRNIKAQSISIGPMDIARAILAPLASLKLTVCLLILSVIVTFIATLEQTRADVFQVKMKHFENLLVEIPFQTFLVPRWFPEYQNVPGSFYIPSGMAILFLMLINLSAAHLLRFRLHAKGKKLILGLFIAAFAAILTWAVIFNGQNSDGFQAQPPISWTQMWMLLQVGLLGLAIGAGISCFMLDRERKTETLLLGLATLVFGSALGLTVFLGEKAFIGDSAMRILWQLTQATIAALVAYLACLVLFKRKGGIVLLHLGIAGLMMNEIYVTTTNEEQRMTIFEGQTVSQAVDLRETEMAIIDTSDPEFDEIVVIPGAKLKSGDTIAHEDLPFDVQCVRYLPNSDIRRRAPMFDNKSDSEEPAANAGIGLRLEAVELPTTSGTDSDQVVDFASAFVELKDKSDGSSLGIHLITQNLDESDADPVAVGDKTYRISLRFKTAYKPYSLKLVDAQRENYLGTDTPRSYSSDVVLNDFENDIQSDQRIWMNNPLRYADETFYQAGMNTLKDGRELTILQIVRNKGWMIPYVCCMFTVVGLIAQFGSTLLDFFEKSRIQEAKLLASSNVTVATVVSTPDKTKKTHSKKQPDIPLEPALANATTGTWKNWIPTAVLAGMLCFWVSGEIRRDQSGKIVGEMRLDLLGQVPVTINGRVQPLDTYARNTARQLSKRETIFDGNDEKQPAIRWLADTMFETDGYQDYRTFRIEDLNILGALELPAAFPKPRDKFRYTLAEMLEAEPKLRKLIPDSDKKDPDTWSVFQKRLSTVSTKMQRLYGLKMAFGARPTTDQPLLLRIEDAGRTISSPLIPLIIPTDDPLTPWISANAFNNRAWLSELAQQFDSDTTASLASAIIAKEIVPPLREDTVRTRIIQRFLADPEFIKVMSEQYSETDPRVLGQLMEENWDQFPEKIKTELVASEGPLVDAMIAQQLPQYESVMEKQLAKINGSSGTVEPTSAELASLLMELKPAYLAGDAEEFNSTLESYLTQVRANPPKGLSSVKSTTERYYNSFAPFYFASVFYLTAFVASVLSWMLFFSPNWRRSFTRAATALLILGVSIHIVGLIMRVVISGRPPITNLYSSVLFVSAGLVCLMLIVERITKLGIGNVMAAVGAFLALLWAWTMTIVDGDTFTVMVAVLDTQFWLSTHVVCISIGYIATFAAGLLGLAYIIAMLVTPVFAFKDARRIFSNVIYGTVCFGLLCSFFGTVLGGLWGDDSWGRFWGWDPKENGALMIVLWNAVVLHARWGGLVRERGLAALAILGNVVVLWSWKGVNAMGVGLHAYAGTEDDTVKIMLIVGLVHVVVAALVVIPSRFWMSYAMDESKKKLKG